MMITKLDRFIIYSIPVLRDFPIGVEYAFEL